MGEGEGGLEVTEKADLCIAGLDGGGAEGRECMGICVVGLGGWERKGRECEGTATASLTTGLDGGGVEERERGGMDTPAICMAGTATDSLCIAGLGGWERKGREPEETATASLITGLDGGGEECEDEDMAMSSLCITGLGG